MNEIKEYIIDNTVKYFFFVIFVFVNWSILGEDTYYNNRPIRAAIMFALLWGALLFAVHKITLLNNEKLILHRVAYKTKINVNEIVSIEESGLGFRIICKTKKIYIQEEVVSFFKPPACCSKLTL